MSRSLTNGKFQTPRCQREGRDQRHPARGRRPVEEEGAGFHSERVLSGLHGRIGRPHRVLCHEGSRRRFHEGRGEGGGAARHPRQQREPDRHHDGDGEAGLVRPGQGGAHAAGDSIEEVKRI